MKQPLLFKKSLNKSLELWRITFFLKGFLYLFTCVLYNDVNAQYQRINGPTGSASFGSSVTVLTNGNYVVTDPFHNIPGVTRVGAVHLYDGQTHALISSIIGSQPDDQVGSGGVTALTNGNFVISSPQWRKGVYLKAGAATWANGITGISGAVSTLNSLTGSTPDDNVSSSGIKALPNDHYVVVSPHWEHNTLLMNDAGAVTWGNGNTGTSGAVTEGNSIVGSRWDDAVGNDGITILSNNNYVITSTKWGGSTPMTSLGAVTWANGLVGTNGRVSASNSLVGSFDGDDIGSQGVKVLANGNYVVCSPLSRQGSAAGAGAVTWGNGLTGTSGVVDVSNSLVGGHIDDHVGALRNTLGGIVTLTNGNYVVVSDSWDNGTKIDVGAVTWCNGLTGKTGLVSASNSLIGSNDMDYLGGWGYGGGGATIPLSNGHYVVSSPSWDNGSVVNTGVVLWCDGNTGVIGELNPANAIVGPQANSWIGNNLTPLTNGNYVIRSEYFSNGGVNSVGAVTWARGMGPTAGTINTGNSIIGTRGFDLQESRIVALSNGNYVISAIHWSNAGVTDAGAATWCNGATPSVGVISAANSLVGNAAEDHVGLRVIPLANGHYVVGSPVWDNGPIVDAGAVTWCDGNTGGKGVLSAANSLVGSSTNDRIASLSITPALGVGIYALANGNYVVESHYWNNGGIAEAGASTLGDGTKGIVGTITADNSLVGSTANDRLGNYFTSTFSNGNYLVQGITWDNGANANVGSMTLGNGSVAMSGIITHCNSVIGQVVNEGGSLKPVYNEVRDYMIVGASRENSVLIYNPSGQNLPISATQASVTVIGNNKIPLTTDGGCNIVVSITPNGSDPVRGKVHAQVWKEETVPSTAIYPYVARHYQITPEKNTSTARVTLYFTYKEFFEFNSHPGSTLNLPINAGDVSEISNLRVEKFAGKSNDDTGLPASYTEGSETINPDDSDIIWNSQQERWEVSFNVNTGFSGFIVHTSSSSLPVRLVQFKGKTQEQNALLQWEIADALNVSHFELERSADAKQFQFVSKVNFSSKENKYEYNDLKASGFVNSENQIYYRLKMLDLDGSYAFSRIVSLKFNDSNQKFAYPNPFVNEVSISVRNQNHQKAEIQFIDSKGSMVLNRNVIVTDNKINLTDLKIPAGTYVIRVTSGSEMVNIKAVKGN